MVTQIMSARIQEIGLFWREKKIRFVTALEETNALNRSYNREHSLHARLFLSYHLIKVKLSFSKICLSKITKVCQGQGKVQEQIQFRIN